MSKPRYWILRVPVLSTAHVSQATIDWLACHSGHTDFGVVAGYPEGFFLYLHDPKAAADLPEDLAVLARWVRRRRYNWLRLDADGDVVDGLPRFPH